MSETHARDEFRFLPFDAERVGRTTPLPEVERVWAEVTDGRRLSGLAFSPSEQPRVVLLHGAGLNAHSFDPALLALSVPALSLDLPGHGRSDWRDDGDYRPAHLAHDLELAITELAPDTSQPLMLVGHSLGGLSASIVASSMQRAGRTLSRLVIIDVTPGLVARGTPKTVIEFIQGKRDFGSVDEIVDRAIEFGIGSNRTTLARGVELNTRVRPDGRLEWTHHLAHLDSSTPRSGSNPQPHSHLWEELETLEFPVTQIRADTGMVGDEETQEWHERLPRSEVVTLVGPHNLHEAAPVELAEILRGYLS